MKHSELIAAAKEVAYVKSLDRICVVTAWLGHHAIVDLGFEDQRLVVTVPVEDLVSGLQASGAGSDTDRLHGEAGANSGRASVPQQHRCSDHQLRRSSGGSLSTKGPRGVPFLYLLQAGEALHAGVA